jgi:hypothetical protein
MRTTPYARPDIPAAGHIPRVAFRLISSALIYGTTVRSLDVIHTALAQRDDLSKARKLVSADNTASTA